MRTFLKWVFIIYIMGWFVGQVIYFPMMFQIISILLFAVGFFVFKIVKGLLELLTGVKKKFL